MSESNDTDPAPAKTTITLPDGTEIDANEFEKLKNVVGSMPESPHGLPFPMLGLDPAASAIGLGGRGLAPSTFKLANGASLRIEDWMQMSLRSAFVIDPWHSNGPPRWELFTYGRGQFVAGSTIRATRAHTNIPRSGDGGLPLDWEMYVLKWRATTNVVLDQEVLDWAAATSVDLHYNQKFYSHVTMLDLLLGAEPLDQTPIHMRSNLSYGANVESEADATRKLQEHLREAVDLAPNVRDAVLEIEALQRHYSLDDRISHNLQHIHQKLVGKARPITFWVHLDGIVKRTVV